MGIYGTYDLSLSLEAPPLKLGVVWEDGFSVYRRELPGKKTEKVLGVGEGNILIHPVEPVVYPKQISHFLEILFDPVVIGPDSTKVIYLTFPLDIGVFLSGDRVAHILDSFSLNRAKFSLYGNPKTGVITKWFRSRTFPTLPKADPLRQGVMKLTLENTMSDFTEVSRGVFEGFGMSLYFDEEGVGMAARMEIRSTLVAETSFIDQPLRAGMNRSIELLEAKKLPVVDIRKIRSISGVELNAFLMEEGYGA